MYILPLYYFAPIPWWVVALQGGTFALEVRENYRKQQYTGRTYIKGPNEIMPLVIPVERRSSKAPLIDKQISNRDRWMEVHKRSIIYSYKNSPYFEYYEEAVCGLFEQEETSLHTFLLNSMNIICGCLCIELPFTPTSSYLPKDSYTIDYRNAFDPTLKSLPPWFKVIPYRQVFGTFQPGLSILDLLFNKGPESVAFLQQSFQS